MKFCTQLPRTCVHKRSDLDYHLYLLESGLRRVNFRLYTEFNQLRMFMTGRSYTQNFFKVQYVIIQGILGRQSIKKFTVPMKKYSMSVRLLTVKQSCGYEDSHSQLWGKAVSMKGKTPKIKFCHKIVKKSR